MKRKFIIDTDTASDDAVALIMATKSKETEIAAITIVAGNVSLEQGAQNALYTLSLCNSDLPVYLGLSKPIVRPLKTADHVHGKDGMSDIGLPLGGFKPNRKHAIQAIIETINENVGEVTLVTLGPLTNIAVAILMDPSIARKLKETIVMGGIGKGRGNVTPIAEYNFWADPEAAKIVFESGMPIKMVGWDISRKYAVFEDKDIADIRAVGTPLADFAVAIQKTLVEYAQTCSHLKGFDLPDPIAMAVAIDPSVATDTKQAHVSILLNHDNSRGQSVVDFVGATRERPNAEVVLKADTKKFREMLHNSLRL